MQIERQQISPTRFKVTLTADQALLEAVKNQTVKRLAASVKVQGFRPGKAPQHLVEKQIDPSVLQSEFLERAVNDCYVSAVHQEKFRPVSQPEIVISKFVPFDTLEFTAEFEAVGDIKLANYKTIKLSPKTGNVTAKDVAKVVENLRERSATKADIRRPAKLGDEVTIDFEGVDAKTGDAISGADGKDSPLLLGSQAFIPGFEDQLVGLKPGQTKKFNLVFPGDYSVAALRSKKVSFSVTIKNLQQLTLPKLDSAFAASVGPFRDVVSLKRDIKKQLQAENDQALQRDYDNKLLSQIVAKSELAIPDVLVDEELDRMEEDEKRNVTYRGQTWQEHLDEEGLSAPAHREKNRPSAALRVKGGLILGEIANAENISVSPKELEARIQLLKGQYPDPTMQSQLDKPENRKDIMSRLLTEKTLDKLRGYATAN